MLQVLGDRRRLRVILQGEVERDAIGREVDLLCREGPVVGGVEPGECAGHEGPVEFLQVFQGVQRLPAVEVPAVLAPPEERAATGHPVDVVDVGAAGGQDGKLGLSEVIPHRADDADRP